MTGTLRQRSPGRWEIRVSTGKDPLTGRYRVTTQTVRGTKRQAQVALAELVAEVARGKHTGTSATLGTLLDRWLDVIAADRSPTTIDGYRGWIEGDIKPRWGDVRISKLEPSELDAWYRALLRGEGRLPGRGPLSVASVRQVHAIIRAALEQGVRWKWLPANPARLASPPTGKGHRIRVPAPDDVLRLIAAMAERRPDLAVLLRLAAATGARRGELCALRWRCVDLQRGVVVIEAAIIETGKGRSVTVEKGTKTDGERKVTIDPDTLAILRSWRLRPEAEVIHGRAPLPSDWVFPRLDDPREPLRPSTVTQMVRKLRDELGLAGVTPHTLRHFQATQLLGQGESVRAVADRLGHADPALTLRTYAHSLPGSDGAAAAIIGRTLALPAGGEDG